jgi:hypothetical protein
MSTRRGPSYDVLSIGEDAEAFLEEETQSFWACRSDFGMALQHVEHAYIEQRSGEHECRDAPTTLERN